MHSVPILTYHAANIDGNDYATNDHVALAEDLRLIDARGYTIVALEQVVNALIDAAPLPERALAISFDDGTDLDFRDLPHPAHGLQRGMLNVMRDFVDQRGAQRQPGLHATSFVVASPAARRELDRTCLIGAGWYNDDWWVPALGTGLIGIGNHSWDHNHSGAGSPTGATTMDDFHGVSTRALADREILQAYQYIAAKAPNGAASLFAYPYGHVNAFLVDEYFPLGPAATGTRAAFSIDPAPVSRGANRWCLPRYVCGLHWRSPDELTYLLGQAA